MKTLLLMTIVMISILSQAQTIIYNQDFESGGAGITMNTTDVSGTATGTNPWVLNNIYAGGPGTFFCPFFGFNIPFTVPAAATQPAGITNNPSSTCLHVTPQIAIAFGGTLPAPSYVVADGLCIVFSNQSTFTRMSSDVSTIGHDSVTLDLWWMCGGSTAFYGEVYYSTNGGSSWTVVNNPISGTNQWRNQTTWVNSVFTNSNWDGQATLRFGFRFVSSATSTGSDLDPGFAVDDIVITGYDIPSGCTPSASSISPTVCDTYTSPSGNFTHTSSTTFNDIIPNTAGCDSVITINLTVNSSTTSSISPTVCDTYTSPSGNFTHTSSTTFNDIIPNTAGCDSVITINLTVNSSTTSTISPTVCDTYTSPSGNFTHTSSQTFNDIIPNTAGCDSVITINLTVNSVNESVNQTGITLSAVTASATYQWLDCNNAYAIIPGATSQNYTATSNGDYALKITANGCTDTSACFSIDEVGISDLNTIFSLYPNPANTFVTVNTGQIIAGQIVITDVLGREVLTAKLQSASTEISLQNLETGGTYFVRLLNTEGEILGVEKLIVH